MYLTVTCQSMDSMGNMRGRFSRIKSLDLRDCPKFYCIWCCSYRFSLVVEKSLELGLQVRYYVLNFQEPYNFMSGHKRHHTFTEKLKKGHVRLEESIWKGSTWQDGPEKVMQSKQGYNLQTSKNNIWLWHCCKHANCIRTFQNSVPSDYLFAI